MEGLFMAEAAFDRLLADYEFQSVLDIGSGEGLHAQRFREAGKTVVTLDASDHWRSRADIKKPFLECGFTEKFDAIWCSHVLEHQLNVNLFLVGLFDTLKPGGILALTVPPWKTTIVGGHLTIWNGGLLLYNLVLAGFDCRDARVGRYGYNISVIVRKRHAQIPALLMDRGDIERLARYFPMPVHQDFDGEITELNWQHGVDFRPVPGRVLASDNLKIDLFQHLPPLESDLANLSWSISCVNIPGLIAEFGIFQGKSLRVLAEQFPDRDIIGFDSFQGLPEPWVRSAQSIYPAGHFALAQPSSDFPSNVRIVPGFFNESLPIWRDTLSSPLALIHIDADLYSSARDVLWHLNDFIVRGTVLVFDELCDWQDSGVYANWPEGEWRALNEWLREFRRSVRILSRGPNFAATVIVE